MIYEFEPSKFLQMNFNEFLENFKLEEIFNSKQYCKFISTNRDKYTFYICGNSVVTKWTGDSYFENLDTIHHINLNGVVYKEVKMNTPTLTLESNNINYDSIEGFYYDCKLIDGTPKSEKPEDHYVWLEHAINDNSFTYVVEKVNKIAQNIILLLAELNIPFKVIQLGGGVKKIIKQSNICPNCNGSGIISPSRKVSNVVYPHHQDGTI